MSIDWVRKLVVNQVERLSSRLRQIRGHIEHQDVYGATPERTAYERQRLTFNSGPGEGITGTADSVVATAKIAT